MSMLFFRRLDPRTARRLAAIRARARGLARPDQPTTSIPVQTMAALVAEARS